MGKLLTRSLLIVTLISITTGCASDLRSLAKPRGGPRFYSNTRLATIKCTDHYAAEVAKDLRDVEIQRHYTTTGVALASGLVAAVSGIIAAANTGKDDGGGKPAVMISASTAGLSALASLVSIVQPPHKASIDSILVQRELLNQHIRKTTLKTRNSVPDDVRLATNRTIALLDRETGNFSATLLDQCIADLTMSVATSTGSSTGP